MKHIHYIKYKADEGKSIRQISRETGHDRKTIRKYLNMTDFSPPDKAKSKRKSKSGKYHAQVKEWLLEDEQAPRKQKHTARRVYDRLKTAAEKDGKTLDISERTVRNLVAEIRQEIDTDGEVFLPLLHPAGEAQVDFGTTVFYENGVEYSGKHLALSFPHSNARFVQLFKGENLLCLLQGLLDMFEWIGAVPTVIRFDNMSTAVKTIKAHGEREVTEGFYRFQYHFGFKSNFCNPASGHEKGSVENCVGYTRRNYFVPVPRFNHLEDYNQCLFNLCEAEMYEEHYKLQRQIKELFEEDRVAMTALPEKSFDVCDYVFARTNNYGMVRYRTNSYSTAGNLYRKDVMLKVKAHTVEIYTEEGEKVITHPRLYGKQKESMLWAPYLEIVAKRPTAMKYTGFFESLPDNTRDLLATSQFEEKQALLSFLAKASKRDGMNTAITVTEKAVRRGARDLDNLVATYQFLLNGQHTIAPMKLADDLLRTKNYDLDFTAYKKLMRTCV
jgi:transposase